MLLVIFIFFVLYTLENYIFSNCCVLFAPFFVLFCFSMFGELVLQNRDTALSFINVTLYNFSPVAE